MTATPPRPPRTLPNGKPVSALGFGCSSVWAQSSFDEDEAGTMLDIAMAEGINHFDTSPSYGPANGENRLGRALSRTNPANLVISTKVGSNLIEGKVIPGFTRDLMERSFEASLRRLGVGYVDILYLHGPSQSDLNDVTLRFFDDVKAAGLIGYSGVNSFNPAVLDACIDLPIDAVMLQLNLGDFRNAAQAERLHAAGKIVISGTAMAQAKFRPSTFIPRNSTSLWYLLRQLKNDPLFPIHGWSLSRKMKGMAARPTEISLRFLTGHPHIVSSLFGTSNPAHLRDNAKIGSMAVDRDEWTQMHRIFAPKNLQQ